MSFFKYDLPKSRNHYTDMLKCAGDMCTMWWVQCAQCGGCSVHNVVDAICTIWWIQCAQCGGCSVHTVVDAMCTM